MNSLPNVHYAVIYNFPRLKVSRGWAVSDGIGFYEIFQVKNDIEFWVSPKTQLQAYPLKRIIS